MAGWHVSAGRFLVLSSRIAILVIDSVIKVLCVFRTCSGAVKTVPVLGKLASYPNRVVSKVCMTGQLCVAAWDGEMLDQVLDLVDVVPDYDLGSAEEKQPPAEVAGAWTTF